MTSNGIKIVISVACDTAAMARLGCIHKAIQSSRGLLEILRLGKPKQRYNKGIIVDNDG